MAKYISGKFKNLKVGIKDYSEGKVALNVVGIISAASYQSGSSGITSTGATFHDLNVSGVSTFAGNINANGNIVGDNSTNITGVYDVEIMNDLDIAGNIVGTNSNISGINSVTATTFYGDGSNLTGIDGVSDGDKGDVVVSAGGTIWNLDTTGVTAGSYNNANITVDAKGRLTAASSGAGGGDANYALNAGIATDVIGGIGSLTALHVTGFSTFTADASALNVSSNTTNPAINIQFSGTTKGSLTPLSDGLGIEVSGGNDIILKSNAYGGTSGDIFLQSGSTKVIAAKGTGEVGIGTDDPGSKLDVHGDVNVTGVATFTDDINANGNIIGDGSTVISGISSLNVSSHLAHTGDTHTKLAFGTGVISLVSNGNTLLSVANIIGGTQINDYLLVSGNAKVTGVATFSGDVSIGGTLTYEDVTNIDSVGFITARSGLNVLGSGTTTTTLNVTGVTTLGTYTYADRIYLGSGNSTYIEESSGINLQTNASKNIILGVNASGGSGGSIKLQKSSGSDSLVVQGDGNVAIAHSLSIARSLDVSGISSVGAAITMYGATGIVSATKYYGDGSDLTNLPSSGISGITIEDEGSALATLATTLDFVGDGVVASGTGAEKTITIAGGGISGITVKDEGSALHNLATTLDFVGAGVTASGTGAEKTITIDGGGGTWTPDAQENLYGGTGAGNVSDADTCYNIGIGYSAGYNLNEGDKNILIGKEAGYALTSGQYNVFLGCEAGRESNGTCNFFVLNRAGDANSGINNVFIGNSAGRATGASTKDASENIAIGRYSGACLDTGDNNIFLGPLSGTCTWSGCNNVFLGQCAGRGNRTGGQNIALGFKSFGGGWNGTGSNNILLGRETGTDLTLGASNIFLGFKAGYGSTAASDNFAAGYCAGYSLTEGDGNIFLGPLAGDTTTSGCCNIAIGYNVELPSTTGNTQLAIGHDTNRWITGDQQFNVTLAGTAVTVTSSGIVSAVTYYGDGSNLTGTGGETLISGITVKEEGSTVGTAGSIKNINFIGDSVTASASGSDTANITITGGAPGDAGYWVKTDVGIHTLSKVGIGTTNPLTNLDVHDEVSFASTVSIGTTIDIVPNNTAGTLSFNGSAGTLLSLSNDLTTGSIFSVADVSGLGAIDVYADRKIAMAYVSAGDSVGIGTTNPLEKLHVVGVVSATSFFGDGSGLTNLPSSGGSYWVKTDAGIHTTSKVGIGTTDPEYDLDLGSYVTNNVSTASTIRIIGENNSTAIRIGPGGTTNDITLIRVDSKNGTTDGTGNTDLGHSLKYMGSGSGADNRLAFWVDNTSNTAYEAVSIYNDGKFVVDGDPSGGGHGFHGTPTDAFTVRGTSKFTDGVCVTGVVTATSFSGDGSCLTGLAGFSPDADENLVAGTNAAASFDGTNACFNVAIGYSAAACDITGSNNVYIGKNAGFARTSGDCNVAIGFCAGGCTGLCGEMGDDNVFLGTYAGAETTRIGSHNVAIGHKALLSGGVCQNIAIGFEAGCKSDFTCGSIFIGYEAGKNATNLLESIVMGYQAGYNHEGDTNIFIGKQAGYGYDSGSDGDKNVVIGFCAARELDGGDCNVLIGSNVAKAGKLDGKYNVALGNFAACNTTTGNDNVAIGCYAGKSLGGGSCNVFLGHTAGCESYGQDNVIIGSGAASGMTGGNWNTVIGKNAATSMTLTGGQNVFLGMEAGCTQTTTCWSVAIGQGARLPITDGCRQLSIGCYSKSWIVGDCDFNVGIGTTIPTAAVGSGNTAVLAVGIVSAYQLYGDGSGLTNVPGWSQDGDSNLYAGTGAGGTSGCCNISVGCNAGPVSDAACSISIGMCAGASLTTSNLNVFIGHHAGKLREDNQSYNIAIGYAAGCGANNSTADDNIAIGRMSGKYAGGQNSIYLGLNAGGCITTGNGNIGLGRCALVGSATTSNNTGSQNIAIGYDAGRSMTSGYENIMIGCNAGKGFSNSYENIAIGICAMMSTTASSVRNLAIGYEAGAYIDGGDDNVILGSYAGKCITTPGCNVYLGFSAGRCVQTGQSNVFIGDAAGYGYTCLGSGSHNVAIGNGALYCVQDAARNIVMGCSAGKCTTSGDHNIFLGTLAGCTNTSGNANIAIGYHIDIPSGTGNGQLAIGNYPNCWIEGDSDMNVTLAGIVTAYATTGIVSATKFCGDGSALTGVGGCSGVGTFDAAAGVAHTINSYTIASETFETSEYTIFAGIGSGIQSQKILVMEDGTTAYSQEYGVMYNNDNQLVSASARIVSGDIRVEVTPETGVTGLTTYRFSRQTT